MSYDYRNQKRQLYSNNHNGQKGNNVQAKTPYAFVPLSDRVFLPDWASKISQDIPFSDGISGSLSFDITAETPTGILSGIREQDDVIRPCRTPDGRYFIPGTAIKGEIRNILDIISFGKIKNVEDARYGIRNINDNTYREHMQGVFCGWLKKEGYCVTLEDCGIPGRVSLNDIDKFLGSQISQSVNNPENLKTDNGRTAMYKYQLAELQAKDCDAISKFYKFNDAKRKKNKKGDKRKFYVFANQNCTKFSGEGRIVFTGQPSIRKQLNTGKMVGKAYEFIFFDLGDNKIEYTVPEKIFREFESIHSSSPDYVDFWKKKLYAGEKIPVFFILEAGAVHSIGLSYMYKYPYKKSVHNAIPKQHLEVDLKDLSECIFGYAGEKDSLRGRVQFGHAFLTGETKLDESVSLNLFGPRASYYPFYVKDGKSWDVAESISGFKRYPVRRKASPKKNKNTPSKVQFFSIGSTFHEVIHFHNLRPVELGALLSAITFHNNTKTCFHSLGYAKPFGYGKVQISDVKLTPAYGEKCLIENCMAAFEEQMDSFLGGKGRWVLSAQVKELFLMAQGIPNNKESGFEYMPLENFSKLKGNYRLPSFSKRVGRSISVNSLTGGGVSQEK